MGFTNFSTHQIEYLGYPTQKPVALLDKLIRASCPPGGLVLDPFCGCGTTVAAAEILQRRWIGIDITYSAIAAIKERFRRRKDLYLWGEIEILGEPRTVTEVEHQLLTTGSAAAARKEFEKFCIATIGGLPNNKMGADGGIDGRILLEGGLTAICSVKSGRVSVKDLRELKGLLNDKQVAGVLITRQPPTPSDAGAGTAVRSRLSGTGGSVLTGSLPANASLDSGGDPDGETAPASLRHVILAAGRCKESVCPQWTNTRINRHQLVRECTSVRRAGTSLPPRLTGETPMASQPESAVVAWRYRGLRRTHSSRDARWSAIR